MHLGNILSEYITKFSQLRLPLKIWSNAPLWSVMRCLNVENGANYRFQKFTKWQWLIIQVDLQNEPVLVEQHEI